ncbi:MAG: hypothetical protein ACI9VS_000662, partial [Candidatus Binatia bacterium]
MLDTLEHLLVKRELVHPIIGGRTIHQASRRARNSSMAARTEGKAI